MSQKYTLKIKGPNAIEIVQPGYMTRTYTRADLVRELLKSDDFDRNDVLIRAAETIDGRSPVDYIRNEENIPVSDPWRERWSGRRGNLRDIYFLPKKPSLLSRILGAILKR